ncbi:alpha/beta hydrolase [Caballeronia sp. Lep1P3]|uniref:RBBP9/YdeN family alpha/beta hydrolase n=1 Tax=Caballeronia sp. Lep1P3 TaxID=2878150 RepID=UPI001FD3E4F3|nr:alpha/beta hydrolase [Caballeronia sp. Lep1P3]
MNDIDYPSGRPVLVTVPGLHGSEGAHWQSWLERQYTESSRVEQADWDAPDLDTWASAVSARLDALRRPVVLAAHSFGCFAAAHALLRAQANASTGTGTHARMLKQVVGVLFVAPASPDKFRLAGRLEPARLRVPSILVGSETDPWMPAHQARDLAQRLGSAFVNFGDAGHINTAAGFGPWPHAKYLVDTLSHHAAPAAPARDTEDAFLREHAYG